MSGKSHNLRLRILSSLVMVPLALAAVSYGNPAYALLVAAGMLVGLVEWLRLVAPNLPRALIVMAGASLLLTLLTGYLVSPVMGCLILALLTGLLLAVACLHDRRLALLVALGLPYLGGGGLALLAIRAAPDYGMVLTFYLLAVVWGSDIGGYAAGRAIGGPKLAPRISPGKTWAGFAGGVVLAALAGGGIVLLTDGRDALAGAILALLLAPVAQAGDLFKSFFKRRAGVKDSGSLIPGHGGVLDRVDGLIFAAICFALLRHGCDACTSWW